MTTPEAQIEPPPPASRHPNGAILCWLLILTLVSVVVYRNAHLQQPGDVQKLMDDQRARLIGLLAVQMKALGADKNSPLSLQTRDSQDQLIRDMEREARTPEDNVRTAILIGELRGAASALDALGKLAGGGSSPEVIQDVSVLKALYADGPGSLDMAARDRLTDRYGDLGKIALAYGVAADRSRASLCRRRR